MTMDLNCDLGELDDAAHEAALMPYVTSANIACGGHAGDEAIMERTAKLALAHGVRTGAHPGYPDREHFGRLDMAMSDAAIEAAVREQIERLERVLAALGARVTHVKPHGALYNTAARDREVARAIGRAVAGWNAQAVVVGLAGSVAVEVWRSMGLAAAAEAFADRRYEADGFLRSRRFPDALITEPREAAAQALDFARRGGIDTLCVHGDTPNAPAIAAACRRALDELCGAAS